MKRGLCLLVLACGLVRAQLAPLVSSPSYTPSLGLGSPVPVTSNKAFEIHNSYTLSYASGGGASMSQGMVLSQMSYKLANPLTLNLDVGMATPLYSSGMTGANVSGNQFLLPRVGLDYRPTENTLISINYSRMPASYYYGYPYGPWGASGWR